MLKLTGFVTGFAFVVFFAQPWIVDHYPALYKKGKAFADITLSMVMDKVQVMALKMDSAANKQGEGNGDLIALTAAQKMPSPAAHKPGSLVITEPAVDEQQGSLPDKTPVVILRQAIWSAFNYEASADAFARQIQEKTQIDVVIRQNAKGRYQLILEADNELEMRSKIERIEQALGLDFSRLMTALSPGGK